MASSAQEERFLQLLRQEQAKLYRIAWAILGSESDARDALQEATIRAYRAFPRLRGGPAAFPQWMRRIVINQCTDMLRQRLRTIPMEYPHEVYPEPTAPEVLPGEDSEVWDAVRGLAEPYRAVVVLRFLADMMLSDIAGALGTPLGTVKSRLHTALSILRERLSATAGERGEAV